MYAPNRRKCYTKYFQKKKKELYEDDFYKFEGIKNCSLNHWGKKFKSLIRMSVEVAESSRTQSPTSYLYTSVIKNHVGEIASQIISTLISYGRLTAKDLSHKSKVPIKLVKTSLVSLIQLNCIFYWKDESSHQVYYNFDESGVLILLHSGDILNHMKSTYGDETAEIIQNVIENGHVKLDDYVSGIEDENKRFEKQDIFLKLFNDKWLIRLQSHNLNPINDLWNKLFNEILKNTPRNTTTSEIKRVNEAKEKAKIKLTEILDSGNSQKDLFTTDRGIKKVKSNIVVKFNLSRFQKHIRSQAFIDLANSRIGLLTSKIYGIALQLIEKDSPEISYPLTKISGLINDPEEERIYISSIENALVDNKQITFNVRDLIRHIPKEIDLRNSILTHNFLKPSMKRVSEVTHDLPTKKIKLENDEFEGDVIDSLPSIEPKQLHQIDDSHDFDSTDNSDPHSLTLVQHHLKLLSSSSAIPFLIELNPGNFTVPYNNLMKFVKDLNFETLIKTTLGQSTLRVLKCIKSQKLSDEKTISNTVLLKEKSVRNEIYKLINMNVIEIQEIPRSADRAASKTFYAFRHKSKTSYTFVANSLMFSMGEIYSKIQDFKLDHKILLEKCEREDVKGHEDELLTETELKTLKSIQDYEISSIGRLNRIKSLYNIFGTF